MSELEYFTVTCAGIASVNVDYVDLGTQPDSAWVYAFCDFVPRLPKGTVIWCSGLDTPRGIQLDTIRARFDIDGVLRTIVGAIQNEVQEITVTGSPTSIVMHLDGQDTASIAMSSNTAAASLVQTRLEALSNVGTGNVFVSGTNPWACTFRGDLAGTDMPQMTGTPTGGTSPSVTVETLETGTQDAGVKLVANTPVISDGLEALGIPELIYDVVFSVPFKTRTVNQFAIAAPTVADTTVDLADHTLHLAAKALKK
jgi:hypothetical protein